MFSGTGISVPNFHISLLFNEAVNNSDWLYNLEKMYKKRLWPNISRLLSGVTEEKPRETSARIISVLGKILTWQLSYTNQKPYPSKYFFYILSFRRSYSVNITFVCCTQTSHRKWFWTWMQSDYYATKNIYNCSRRQSVIPFVFLQRAINKWRTDT